MSKLLLKFWPILVPFIIYFIWKVFFRKMRIKKGKPLPKWEGKFFTWAILSSFFIAVLLLATMVLFTEKNTGDFAPAEYKTPHLAPTAPVKIESEK